MSSYVAWLQINVNWIHWLKRFKKFIAVKVVQRKTDKSLTNTSAYTFAYVCVCVCVYDMQCRTGPRIGRSLLRPLLLLCSIMTRLDHAEGRARMAATVTASGAIVQGQGLTVATSGVHSSFLISSHDRIDLSGLGAIELALEYLSERKKPPLWLGRATLATSWTSDVSRVLY